MFKLFKVQRSAHGSVRECAHGSDTLAKTGGGLLKRSPTRSTQRHEITFELWLHKTTLLPPPMRRLPQHSTYGKVRPFDGLISGTDFETGSSSSIKHGLGGDLVSSGLAFDVLLPATVGGRRIVPKAL